MSDLPEPQDDEQGEDFEIQTEELDADEDIVLSEAVDIPLYDFQEESVKLMTQVIPIPLEARNSPSDARAILHTQSHPPGGTEFSVSAV